MSCAAVQSSMVPRAARGRHVAGVSRSVTGGRGPTEVCRLSTRRTMTSSTDHLPDDVTDTCAVVMHLCVDGVCEDRVMYRQ